MTKEQMLSECRAARYANNYENIQKQIKAAMLKGEHCIYFAKECYKDKYEDDYVCLNETANKLRDDGFVVEEASYDQWEVSWDE